MKLQFTFANIKNYTKAKSLHFTIHAIGWAIFLFLPILVFQTEVPLNLNSYYYYLFALGFIHFYLNYFFLTPHFLLKKKYLLFTVTILTLVFINHFLIEPIIQQSTLGEFGQVNEDIPSDAIQYSILNLQNKSRFEKILHGDRKILGFYIMLLIFLILSSTIRIFMKLKEEEKIKQLLLTDKLNAEILQLRHQVNPHFLFNSLNNIYALATRNSENTAEAVVKLSSLLRYMLYESSKPSISLKKELDLIDDFIDLQKLRYKNNIIIKFEKVNITDGYVIEPLLLNPLVENAFKFGVVAHKRSTIHIRCEQKEESLNFSIRNEKIAPQNVKNQHSGIGLNNIISRLNLHYPDQHTIDFDENDETYTVNLSIKLKRNTDLKQS
ncbi:hypothetical protein EYV94_01255 [Puteibacter caeruleilacunae]|nr:hypothetical protein EYV94_01255 [Puteibacter caeruleilacunae]